MLDFSYAFHLLTNIVTRQRTRDKRWIISFVFEGMGREGGMKKALKKVKGEVRKKGKGRERGEQTLM